MTRESIRIRFCPQCGAQKIEIHDRESAWILGSCQTFFCEVCYNSGFVDFDADPQVKQMRIGAKTRKS